MCMCMIEIDRERERRGVLQNKTNKKQREGERSMDIELVKCESCGLKEECTKGYISQIKSNFEDTWLCGLCSEAVHEELRRGPSVCDLKGAMRAHMSFCQQSRVSPAMGVADGVRQMLRRRYGEIKFD